MAGVPAHVEMAGVPAHDAMDAVLIAAVRYGDLGDVHRWLACGSNPNAVDVDFGASALTWAVCVDDVPKAAALVSAGASANARTRSGVTPLHHAATNPSGGCCRVLLEAGADVDAVNDDGWTALHAAACRGTIHCATLLVAAGARLGAVTASGKTPVDIALALDKPAMVRLLAAAARWAGLRRLALVAWCWQP